MLSLPPVVLAYIGPETIVPLTSALAAIAGVLMLCWNSVRQGLAWCWGKFKRDKPS